eukprot:Skav228146  [mRNA]  locus=scaffold2683:81605:82027:+ [translate_table: standard]
MWFCCLATLFLFNIETARAVRPAASILTELNAEEEEALSGKQCELKSHAHCTAQIQQMAIAACARARKWQISDRDEMACEMSTLGPVKNPDDCRVMELRGDDWMCLKPEEECDEDDLDKHSLDDLGNDIPLDTVWFWRKD